MGYEVKLFTSDENERASWEGLRDFALVMPTGWSLAGGTLVGLHAAERGVPFPRSTTDIDLILDIRAHPQSKEKVGPALKQCGFFIPPPPNPAGKDHRWVRPVPGREKVKAQIDVLAPSFLGPQSEERKFPGIGKLLSTRGAQVGIDRSEMIAVNIDDAFEITLSRPDLIGAVYEKCSALKNVGEQSFDRHFEDISFLTSLLEVEELQELAALRRRELLRLQQGMRQSVDFLGARASEELQRAIVVCEEYLRAHG